MTAIFWTASSPKWWRFFQHQGYVYQGNYTEFAKKKAKIREDLLKQYYNQRREIKHQEGGHHKAQVF